MASLFATLLGVDFPIATALIDGAINFTHKRNMIVIVAESRITDKQVKIALKEALKELQDIGERRAKVVHGKWSTCEDFPDSLLWQAKTWAADGFIEYKEADFQELISRIIERRSALQMMIMEIAKHLGLLPGEQKPQGALAPAPPQDTQKLG